MSVILPPSGCSANNSRTIGIATDTPTGSVAITKKEACRNIVVAIISVDVIADMIVSYCYDYDRLLLFDNFSHVTKPFMWILDTSIIYDIIDHYSHSSDNTSSEMVGDVKWLTYANLPVEAKGASISVITSSSLLSSASSESTHSMSDKSVINDSNRHQSMDRLLIAGFSSTLIPAAGITWNVSYVPLHHLDDAHHYQHPDQVDHSDLKVASVPMSPMPHNRTEMAHVRLTGDRAHEILYCGGYKDAWKCTHVQSYNIITNTWTDELPMHFRRAAACAVVDPRNGYVYVLDDNCATIDCYHPVTRNWHEISIDYDRAFTAGVWIPSLNGILLSGGDPTMFETIPDCYLVVYQPDINKTTTLSSPSSLTDPNTGVITITNGWALPIPCHYPSLHLLDGRYLVYTAQHQHTMPRTRAPSAYVTDLHVVAPPLQLKLATPSTTTASSCAMIWYPLPAIPTIG